MITQLSLPLVRIKSGISPTIDHNHLNSGNHENHLRTISALLKSGSLAASDEEINRGKSITPAPTAGGSGDNTGEYEIENAKSSRSICKSCNEKIEKGHVSEMLLQFTLSSGLCGDNQVVPVCLH